MGAVLLFILMFIGGWLVLLRGPAVAVGVAVAAIVLWLVLEVVLPTLLANRAWFRWHLSRRRTPAVRSRPTHSDAPPPAPRWPSWVEDGAEVATPLGRPDLDTELRAVGWDAWAADHRLRVLDVVPDPGHPSADLTLFEVTAGRWTGTRLVQVIDASPNGHGVHERHALCVPASCETALAAIAATWGLTAESYHPQRHT